MIFESPYKINSIGFDTRDNIIVIGEYAIPRDATINGNLTLMFCRRIHMEHLMDSGTTVRLRLWHLQLTVTENV